MNTTNRNAIDFDDLVKRMSLPEKRITSEKLAISGGEILATKETTLAQEIEGFLNTWDLASRKMTIAVWEYMSAIEMVRDQPPTNYSELWRGRVFGEGGDLSLRRDEHRFLWHFTGEPETVPKGLAAQDFWVEQKSLPAEQRVSELIHQPDVEALLWGERVVLDEVKEIRWHEDRVAAAELNYPGMETAGRVKVRYSVYWANGRPAFVWLRDLIAA